MDHKKISQAAKTLIPPMATLAKEAVDQVALKTADSDIRSTFSAVVSQVQALAYEKYLQYESLACAKALRDALTNELNSKSTAQDVVELVCSNAHQLDRVFLSLSQSRKSRAGSTFESVVTHLLSAAGYPYEAQPDLSESRPDYVLPSLAHYSIHATDCILLTCKRTLRERWRQIVTEGAAGQFFLATIDERISPAELDRMKDRRVMVVVPAPIKSTKYPDVPNVISFESFLGLYLDPAVSRWRAVGAL